MPDGSVRTCDSGHAYTSAVVVRDPEGWRVVSFWESADVARDVALSWAGSHPGLDCTVVVTRPVVKLTLSQRRFLREIGERELSLRSTVQIFGLVRRGLVSRRRIDGDRWSVRRTDAGRSAILDQDALDVERSKSARRSS